MQHVPYVSNHKLTLSLKCYFVGYGHFGNDTFHETQFCAKHFTANIGIFQDIIAWASLNSDLKS